MIWSRLSKASIPTLCALGLSGCMHVPVATVYKLATFDILNANPAVIRAAVRYPSALMVRPGGVILSVTTERRGEKAKSIETFILEEAKDANELAAIARYRRDGMMVATYRLADGDVVRVRDLLTQHREMAKQGGQPGTKGIGVAATACHKGALPAGPILTSTYLKLDAADGYLPILEDLDLRSQLSAEALAAEIRPCT